MEQVFGSMRIGDWLRGAWLPSGKNSDCASKSTIFDSSTDFFVALRALVFVADGSFATVPFAAEALFMDACLAGIVSFSWHLGQGPVC